MIARGVGPQTVPRWPPDILWPELCSTAHEEAERSLLPVLGTTAAQGGSPTEPCEGDPVAGVLWVRTRAGPMCVHLPAGSSGSAPQELLMRAGELKTTCVREELRVTGGKEDRSLGGD